MKRKLKYLCFFIILAIVVVESINLFQFNKTDKVKGKIHVWVSEDTYDYMALCADNFMKDNDKVSITVEKVQNYKNFNNKLNSDDLNTVQIFEMNYDTLLNNNIDKFEYYDLNGEVMKGYSSNFSDNTLKKYTSLYKKSALPFTTRPLSLYVNNTMLNIYGYSKDDFNTWDDVIRIGTDIYNRSNKKVKLLSGYGDNYDDLINLLIMENINKYSESKEAELAIKNKIQQLKNFNILAYKNEDYIIKISSINGLKDILKDKSTNEWSLVNVPSEKFGENKFFSTDDTQLYILKNNNNQLAYKFINYILTEEKESIKNMQQANFFLSYLYYYKNKKIENKPDNIQGQSPLVVLSNIETKSEYIKDYDKYSEIKNNLELK